MPPEAPSYGVISVPTRGLRGFLNFATAAPLAYELLPSVGGTRRVIVPWSQPTLMRTRLITGFSIPFIMQIIVQGGGGDLANPALPAVQMEIYNNNSLVYTSGLEAIAPTVIAEAQSNATTGWGVLAADLTNPIVVEANSQLELGVRGIAPIMGGGGEAQIEMGMNYSVRDGARVDNTLAEIFLYEALHGVGPGNGTGNFHYEEVDKYPQR